MLTRIVLSLDMQERATLLDLAHKEMRSPRDQARFLLREAMAKYAGPSDAKQSRATGSARANKEVKRAD